MLNTYFREKLEFGGILRQLLIWEPGNIATLTWKRFKDGFDNMFFPESTKQQKAHEFSNLVQGKETAE